jgi:glycerol-3-phosphate acyltransferase PlsY
MNISILLIVVIIAYLIGSISFARMVTKLVSPTADLDQARNHISDTGEAGTVSGIGASTASMVLGKKYGGIVALLDMLKAFIPIIILRIAFPDQPYYLTFSIFVIIGHNYPIYYRFKGGRGLSPMLGSLLAIDPLGMIVAMVTGTLLAIFINQPPASLILWFPMLAIWSWLVRHNTPIAVYTIVLLVLFLIAEIPEMRLALQYQKQGKMDKYNRMILESAPQTRMMKRLAEKIRFWDKKKNTSP